MQFLFSKTFLLSLLLSFLMCAVIIGDNVSETLLLTFYSTDQLSMMFIVNAIILFGISLLVIGSIDKLPRIKLFTILIFSQCTLLLVIWVTRDGFSELPARLPELIPDTDLVSWYGVFSASFLAFYAFLGFEDMLQDMVTADQVKSLV